MKVLYTALVVIGVIAVTLGPAIVVLSQGGGTLLASGVALVLGFIWGRVAEMVMRQIWS